MKNPFFSFSEYCSSNPLIPHILVVDDEPVLRDLIVRFYSTIDCTDVAVASGEEAFAHGTSISSSPTFNCRG
jgi:hypothetical protein